jgi:hypothetical protein
MICLNSSSSPSEYLVFSAISYDFLSGKGIYFLLI